MTTAALPGAVANARATVLVVQQSGLRVELSDQGTAFELHLGEGLEQEFAEVSQWAGIGEIVLGVDAAGWRELLAGTTTVSELIQRQVAAAVPNAAAVEGFLAAARLTRVA